MTLRVASDRTSTTGGGETEDSGVSGRIGGTGDAASHHIAPDRAPVSARQLWVAVLVGAALLAVIGTWLVWFFAYATRAMSQDEVRAACQRAMPDSSDRCFDTVVIQRGGTRR
jgi:hypothetical protein